MNDDIRLVGIVLVCLNLVTFAATVALMEFQTTELELAIALHTKNAHIVVERHHVLTQEEARELSNE